MATGCINLVEFVDSRGLNLKADRDNAVVKGVKILGRTSRNNRTYSEAAIASAVPLYEGRQSYVDHPPKGKEGDPRPYRELLGTVQNVHVREGELYGDFHYNPKHELAEQFLWDAEHAPHKIGFSHVCQGRSTNQNGKTVVESILSVQSVDLVTSPATTRSLFESESIDNQEPAAMSLKDLTLEQLKAERADLYESVLTEQANGQAAKAKDVELANLREEVKTLKAEKAAAVLETTIANELTEAKLPESIVTDAFKKSLRALDADGRKAVIDGLKESVEALPVKPQSKEQRLAEGVVQAVDSKALVGSWG